MPEFDTESYKGTTDITFKKQLYHLFGGNNLAEMSIRPVWHLQEGKVYNIYSGGNKGDMTHPNGILLSLSGAAMNVENIYGGCRMSNVLPKLNGVPVGSINQEVFDGYTFPAGYSARVRVTGGTVGNVYGGNDISGNVSFGTNVVIESDIVNNVYGSGNGSYVYTDQDASSEYYYDPGTGATPLQSLQALNSHRPNSQKALITLLGTSASDPTYIGGAVYCGGNSATLRNPNGGLDDNVGAKLIIGSHVIANQVFMGSNGENMVKSAMLQGYNGSGHSANLTVAAQFDEYMRGVEVAVRPEVEFVQGYVAGSSKIGSFYCGGNVGSMTASNTFNINFLNKLIIFDKLVAGCNNANVPQTSDNAYHMGGLTSYSATKVILELDGLKMEPKKLTYDAVHGTFNFVWDRYDVPGTASYGFLKGGNIYGGCYQSGYVNGGVQINIKSNLVSDATYKEIQTASISAGVPIYGFHPYDWNHHSKEQSISTLAAYGGGYGVETEIWGDVNINITDSARYLKVRGGSEKGWIGKMNRDAVTGAINDSTVYKAINPDGTKTDIQLKKVVKAYNTTVTMSAKLLTSDGNVLDHDGRVITNIGDICGGGYEGVVTGNSTVYLNTGCAYNVFGGASNADIYGAAQVIIGQSGRPYVTQAVYGGNDFGGQIIGTLTHNASVVEGLATVTKKIRSNTYINYISGEIGYGKGELNTVNVPDANYGIFGAANGNYDYTAAIHSSRFVTKPNMLTRLKAGNDTTAYNSFVNISTTSSDILDKIFNVYGGGEGKEGAMGVADTYKTYVLFNTKNAADRGSSGNYIAKYVYAGGNCSRTNVSLLDAYSGYAEYIFGGCHGSNDKNQSLTYMGDTALVNLYPTLRSPEMDVFGSGALSGTKETFVNLYGGTVHNVYGSTYEEGITYQSNVEVPYTSTANVNAIFGGGKGLSVPNACDTYISVIDFKAPFASVKEAIYGGNDSCRMTRNSYLNISVPVTNEQGNLIDIYGAGYGANTFAGYTYVNLKGTAAGDSAEVKNVYGGGRNGSVYNAPTVAKFLLKEDYYAKDGDNTTTYLTDVEAGGFNAWKNARTSSLLYDGGLAYNTIPDIALDSTSADTPSSGLRMNTIVMIPQGVSVKENAYGGGYGANATVAGQTDVELAGGTVIGDIYGGGYGGDVKKALALTTAGSDWYATNVNLLGGTTTNSYGGGYEGSVFGNAYTFVGRESCNGSAVTFLDGDPAIGRSLYGGGQKGAVSGTAYLEMYNGHVGYAYDANTGLYYENLNLKSFAQTGKNDSLLYQNGNVFGGGYGEGAYTTATRVNMYDGIVRNSIYGGGEIASIGQGTTKEAGDGSVSRILDRVISSGDTHLTIYGGEILRDVFGGGRGYSYDLSGNELTGDKFYTDGYVFGSTEVKIHGGIIGTVAGIEEGYGNVFGGGNVGFVYSTTGTKATSTSGGKTVGYYYDSSNHLTEDCRVVISPYCKVTGPQGVKINGHQFQKCDYVETEYLNYLPKASTAWDSIDWRTGVTIMNAVFAGGNVTRGSDKLYANTTTVYGNVTAALNDIYHKDLISVGSDFVGGLYGDGNLTMVDGYREIAIINYGTDYYNLQSEITVEEYNLLSDRERAYFELKYKCINAYSTYTLGQVISSDVYKALPEGDKVNWAQAGFCSIYSGRILNTIQRADFCGVHGSRIVLQGAQDRVVDVMDYTNYAINRVHEVSLNKRNSLITHEIEGEDHHGNYFGMYNIVNFLGALTSDVKFDTLRYAKKSTWQVVEGTGKDISDRSYYQFKIDNLNDQHRNNGTSDNQIAMSNGVYLELVDHLATGTETVGDYTYQEGEKVYGPVTGIIEIDLINATADMGGGYVYAQNIHGTPTFHPELNEKATLSDYNNGAITNAGYTYATATDADLMQTSGNFVHYLKQIVDDCYPNNGTYSTSPAHFWYLRGQVFVYDQYISAYSGSATAYKTEVQIPLTITSGSNGLIRVMDIRPNYYAFYKAAGQRLNSGETVRANNVTYGLNDIISYWEYSNLSPTEQLLFVDSTFVCKEDLYQDEAHTSLQIAKDSVLSAAQYKSIKDAVFYDKNGNETTGKAWVRLSNGTTHDKGYVLTADVTNPLAWDDRYTRKSDATHHNVISKTAYAALPDADKLLYAQAPTYYVKDDGVYGQVWYDAGSILPKETYDAYSALGSDTVGLGVLRVQAVVEPAFVSTEPVSYEIRGKIRDIQEGVTIPKSDYDYLGTSGQTTQQNAFDSAFVCNTTFMNGDVYVLSGEIYSKTTYDTLSTVKKKNFSKAYYCKKAGYYGGVKYASGTNFEALGSYSAITTDRDKFVYNFDALDLLYNNLDGDWKRGYDTTNSNGYTYTQRIAIEYTATSKTTFTYTDGSGVSQTITAGTSLTNTQFQDIPNEKAHYAKFTTETAGETVYIVKEEFVIGSTYYKVGAKVSQEAYTAFSDAVKAKIGTYTLPSTAGAGDYYFCKETYVAGEKGLASGDAVRVTNVLNNAPYVSGNTVPAEIIISGTDYTTLPNCQKNFTISGKSPIETSTLYVPRMSDILDQTKERIITLVYQYQYEESTSDGTETEEVSERHVLNIHLQFKTGVPTIGELTAPSMVLPGATIGLKQPVVAKGAYEIIGGGWEVYEKEEDALNHENGVAYSNNYTPMYFFQDGYYVAYYAKTYLGKTYSNAVQFKVANYHSIDAVLEDSVSHLHIDNSNVKRNCKIYITDKASTVAPDEKNEIDLLMDLHTLCTTGLTGHGTVSTYIKDCKNLDIIFSNDVRPKGAWTPIGSMGKCFEGNIHGDGHYIDGLTASLFDYFCGNVYNLGLLGSFAGSGLSDNGSGNAYNCWILTSGTPYTDTYPFMGSGSGVISNCYYYNDYKDPTGLSDWEVYKKPFNAFNNGDVAYNLNRYYLTKRYTDTRTLSRNPYNYYTVEQNALVFRESHYEDADAIFPWTVGDGTKMLGYVESRFIDGDFIYANGTIPTEVDERLYSDDTYYPIYPDDYLYFGQLLSYNYVGGHPHQEYPSAIVKTSTNRVLTTTESSSRVYRTPAYFGNKNKSLAYFNVNAILPSAYTKTNSTHKADTTKNVVPAITETKTTTNTNTVVDGRTTTTMVIVTTENKDLNTRIVDTTITVATEKDAYPGMTALDLTGHGDYSASKKTNGFFYTPIMDYIGIEGFNNNGQTQNMLVYDESAGDELILASYFTEPAIGENSSHGSTTVDIVNDASVSSVRGHLVTKTGTGSYEADDNHFLVDRQVFNAPIAYQFSGSDRMWYQRRPDNYASMTAGSEVVSLPFTVEMLTTQQKGEITHFYDKSQKGHEYWLRLFDGVVSANDSVVEADFALPVSVSTDATKTDGNTFLWDYYYSGQDKQNDEYQAYYNESRSYDHYPLAKAATPYLLGLPGSIFYEFDLSGSFVPKNTGSIISKLDAQVVTMLSPLGAGISVSDDELSAGTVTAEGYVFRPNYGNGSVPAGSFLLNARGDGFDITTSRVQTVPFRPYFTRTGASPAPGVQKIVFSSLAFDKGSTLDPVGGIEVWVSKGHIVVESHLDYDRTVTIINSSGLTIARFNLTAGSRISTSMQAPGVYMVAGHKVVVM